jgi:hypothetical protein
VLQESLLYSEHSGKAEIDTECLRLAAKNQMRHMFVSPPSRDVGFLFEIVSEILWPSFNSLLFSVYTTKDGLMYDLFEGTSLFKSLLIVFGIAFFKRSLKV